MWTEHHRELYERSCERYPSDLRETQGPKASPSAAIIDSQSLKSAKKRGRHDGAVGYDTGEKIRGRKLHLLADTEGFPPGALSDHDGAVLMLERIRQCFLARAHLG